MKDSGQIANRAFNGPRERFGRSFWPSLLTILFLFLIRFIPLLKQDARLWGFNHLIFLPLVFTIIYGVLAAIALPMPFLSFSAKTGEYISQKFSEIFFTSGRRYLYRALFIAVMGLLFVAFSAPTHFLGDGYNWLGNLASRSGTIFKWSERGITLVLVNIQALLGPKNARTAQTAFQIVSVLSGVISIWFFFLISQVISQNPMTRTLVFFGMFMSGALLLFFGYVENYPLLWVFLTGYVYFSLYYLTEHRQLPIALTFLALGLIVHLQMIICIPASLYLIFRSRAALEFYRRRRKVAWAILAVIALFGVIGFIYRYTTDLYFEGIFLAVLKGSPVDPSYTMFSLPHFVDMVNELFLLSPLILLYLLLSAGRLRTLLGRPDTVFLALIGSAGLLFLFVIDGTLGMARDWDLFSTCGFALTLLFILLLDEDRCRALTRFLPTVTVLWIMAPLFFLMTNLQTERSIEYHKYCLNLDRKGAFSSLVTLRDYYRDLNDDRKVDSLNQIIGLRFPDEISIFRAHDALARNDIQTARQILNTVIPNKFSSDYHNLLGSIYLREGSYEKAVDELEKAVQLQSYNPNLLSNLALAYANLGRLDRSYKALKRGYRLNRRHAGILRGLADYHLLRSNIDSALYFAERLVSVDSTRVIGYFMLARIYTEKPDILQARKYIGMYLKYGTSDPMFNRRSLMLLKLLEPRQKNESRTK